MLWFTQLPTVLWFTQLPTMALAVAKAAPTIGSKFQVLMVKFVTVFFSVAILAEAINTFVRSIHLGQGHPSALSIMDVTSGSWVVLRRNLHAEGRPSVLRGTVGVIEQIEPLVVYFGENAEEFRPTRHVMVRCSAEWLEPWPGTVARALARSAASRASLYTLGMIVTDVKYPQPDDPHYERWFSNVCRATGGGVGCEVWNSNLTIDATFIRPGLRNRNLDPSTLGLILCEQPNSESEDQVSLQHRIVTSWISQWKDSGVLCIAIMRDWCAARLVTRMTERHNSLCRRLSIVDIHMHYEPIRNATRWASADGTLVGRPSTIWKAVIVQPSERMPIQVPEPMNIAELVWYMAAVHGKRTLQTAAYTMESTLAIIDHFNEQLVLHGM